MDTGRSSCHPTVDTPPARSLASGILGLMLLFFSIPAAAAPEPAHESKDAPHVFSLIEEETVSTAIRREQPISQAPSNVYVITAEDIRQSGAPDVPTILRRIPGLDVMQGPERTSTSVCAATSNCSPTRCSCWSTAAPSISMPKGLSSGKACR